MPQQLYIRLNQRGRIATQRIAQSLRAALQRNQPRGERTRAAVRRRLLELQAFAVENTKATTALAATLDDGTQLFFLGNALSPGTTPHQALTAAGYHGPIS